MGLKLTSTDEVVHATGSASNWNESRYVDFWDSEQRIGGWFRIGNRPNEGHGEISACLDLPDGCVAFCFERPRIDANTLASGRQSWEIVEPWRKTRVRFQGEMMTLYDPWLLKDPKKTFTTAPRTHADIDLMVNTFGLHTVMGFDQDHIDRIFVPGQADLPLPASRSHRGYVATRRQDLDRERLRRGRTIRGSAQLARENLPALASSRLDDDNGFMLVRAVGPTKQTRSGFAF